LVLSPELLELGCVSINLSLLVILPYFPAHQLIADQRSGNQSNRPADQCARCRMTHRAADNCAGSGSQAGVVSIIAYSHSP
jgi:hypothetical protein